MAGWKAGQQVCPAWRKYGASLQREAAFRSKLELLKWLLEQGVAPNCPDAMGRTGLWWACHRRRTESVRLLLEAGADPNLADTLGVAPTMRASNLAILRLLLRHGADVNHRDHKGIRVWESLGHRPEALRLLLEYGEDRPGGVVAGPDVPALGSLAFP